MPSNLWHSGAQYRPCGPALQLLCPVLLHCVHPGSAAYRSACGCLPRPRALPAELAESHRALVPLALSAPPLLPLHPQGFPCRRRLCSASAFAFASAFTSAAALATAAVLAAAAALPSASSASASASALASASAFAFSAFAAALAVASALAFPAATALAFAAASPPPHRAAGRNGRLPSVEAVLVPDRRPLRLGPASSADFFAPKLAKRLRRYTRNLPNIGHYHPPSRCGAHGSKHPASSRSLAPHTAQRTHPYP